VADRALGLGTTRVRSGVLNAHSHRPASGAHSGVRKGPHLEAGTNAGSQCLITQKTPKPTATPAVLRMMSSMSVIL